MKGAGHKILPVSTLTTISLTRMCPIINVYNSMLGNQDESSTTLSKQPA